MAEKIRVKIFCVIFGTCKYSTFIVIAYYGQLYVSRDFIERKFAANPIP